MKKRGADIDAPLSLALAYFRVADESLDLP